MSILIVEKNNKSAELIYEIFNEEKKDLFFACDEEQALIAFRKYEISTVIIDLEILFIDTFKLIQIMKRENPKIEIISLNSILHNYNKTKQKIENKMLELSRADFSESLMNLMIFQKAFETNKESL